MIWSFSHFFGGADTLVRVGALAPRADWPVRPMTDNISGLMWQKQDDATTRTWAAALSYCPSLSLGGYSDWRLPNVKELESITDDTVYNPAINATYFPGTQSSLYWSSTTYAPGTASAWNQSFGNGYVYYDVKTTPYYVRCVRGAP